MLDFSWGNAALIWPHGRKGVGMWQSKSAASAVSRLVLWVFVHHFAIKLMSQPRLSLEEVGRFTGSCRTVNWTFVWSVWVEAGVEVTRSGCGQGFLAARGNGNAGRPWVNHYNTACCMVWFQRGLGVGMGILWNLSTLIPIPLNSCSLMILLSIILVRINLSSFQKLKKFKLKG